MPKKRRAIPPPPCILIAQCEDNQYNLLSALPKSGVGLRLLLALCECAVFPLT